MSLEDESPGTEVGNPEAVELTEREILIAQGEDPDDVRIDDAPQGEAEPDGPVEEQDAPSDPPGDDPPEPQAWHSADDLALAKKYGLDETDLALFEDRKDFRRWALDRVGKAEPQADSDDDEPAAETDDDQPVTKDGKVNVEYYKANDYDDATVAAMVALRKQQDDMERLLQSQQQQYSQAEEAQFAAAFHDAADSLGKDFYGDSTKGQLSPEAAQRREALYDAAEMRAQYIAQRQQREGKPISIPPLADLLKEAEAIAFPERKSAAKPNLAAARQQAARIRPAGGSPGASPGRKVTTPDSDDPEVIANDPELVAIWERSQG